jgi:transposase
MERSTIVYLKKKGWSNSQIAGFTGHHRDTIARVLREPVDRTPAPRERQSAIAVFDEEITQRLAQGLSSTRMVELARQHPEHPYQGGNTAFFTYVRRRRRQLGQWTPRDAAVRFEGLPGEFLHIDWGEVRDFPFSRAEHSGQTRYFFAARLKYSRAMYVSFHQDMREETLLRCLIACFQAFGGMPWVVTTDNMKTVVVGRDEQHQPIWHLAYQRLAVEFGFHPEACSPAAGNQKGAAENLVGFVRRNFFVPLPDVASFAALNQVLLEACLRDDHRQVAHQQGTIAAMWETERPLLRTLPPFAFACCVLSQGRVTPYSQVVFETNRYSLPVHRTIREVTIKAYPFVVELLDRTTVLARHERCYGRDQDIFDPLH